MVDYDSSVLELPVNDVRAFDGGGGDRNNDDDDDEVEADLPGDDDDDDFEGGSEGVVNESSAFLPTRAPNCTPTATRAPSPTSHR